MVREVSSLEEGQIAEINICGIVVSADGDYFFRPKNSLYQDHLERTVSISHHEGEYILGEWEHDVCPPFNRDHKFSGLDEDFLLKIGFLKAKTYEPSIGDVICFLNDRMNSYTKDEEFMKAADVRDAVNSLGS